MVEKGVRFVQLYDWGWDSHGASPGEALDEGFLKNARKPTDRLLHLFSISNKEVFWMRR